MSVDLEVICCNGLFIRTKHIFTETFPAEAYSCLQVCVFFFETVPNQLFPTSQNSMFLLWISILSLFSSFQQNKTLLNKKDTFKIPNFQKSILKIPSILKDTKYRTLGKPSRRARGCHRSYGHGQCPKFYGFFMASLLRCCAVQPCGRKLKLYKYTQSLIGAPDPLPETGVLANQKHRFHATVTAMLT